MPLKLYVAITDFDWFSFLSSRANIDEVNFWQPGGDRAFRALAGEPFLFKLHSPRNYIVGGGFFIAWSKLPVSLAWESFEQKNGATSLEEMRQRVTKYRANVTSGDYQIGCILLGEPFFWHEHDWIPIPRDWQPNIQVGRTYDLTTGHGKELWVRVKQRLQAERLKNVSKLMLAESTARHGPPTQILPRLGQGAFRILVTDAYKRRCAVTGERTLPALEAAHIKPFGEDGPHRLDNGILLRSDLHRLFDRGYVTVSSDYVFDVSRRIQEEFENGRDYYKLRGQTINLPQHAEAHPSKTFLRWHNEKIFLG